ncbi:putative NTF2-like domain superfamily protein [Helianthus anomalus]
MNRRPRTLSQRSLLRRATGDRKGRGTPTSLKLTPFCCFTPKYTSRSRRSRLKVSSRVKDLEPCVSTIKQVEEEEEKQNYYVNTGTYYGYKILFRYQLCSRLTAKTLFFKKTIDRDDIVFKDPLNSFFGIENYKSIFWALRFTGRIFFKALWVDIISVWQPVETTIMIRWTVHGIPRLPLERRTRFDATSEYKLDKRGKIYEHRVHNIYSLECSSLQDFRFYR